MSASHGVNITSNNSANRWRPTNLAGTRCDWRGSVFEPTSPEAYSGEKEHQNNMLALFILSGINQWLVVFSRDLRAVGRRRKMNWVPG